MKTLALAIVTAAACGAPAGSTGPLVLRPSLQVPMDSLSFYVGTWRCKGTSWGTAGEGVETWQASVVVMPELDGKWLSVQMIGPDSNRTIEHKGYDPATKTWHHLAVTNDGSWGTMTSKGWDGSRMVFTPDDREDKTRATFTKRGEREYSHTVSRASEQGEQMLWEKICTK